MTILNSIDRANCNTQITTYTQAQKTKRVVVVPPPPSGKVRVVGTLLNLALNPFGPLPCEMGLAGGEALGELVDLYLGSLLISRETLTTGGFDAPLLFIRPDEDLAVEVPAASPDLGSEPLVMRATYFDVAGYLVRTERILLTTSYQDVVPAPPTSQKYIGVGSAGHDSGGNWTALLFTNTGTGARVVTEKLLQNGVLVPESEIAHGVPAQSSSPQQNEPNNSTLVFDNTRQMQAKVDAGAGDVWALPTYLVTGK